MEKENRKYDTDALKHEVINQFETDIDENDFDAIDELLDKLLSNNQEDILFNYLSDSAQKNLKEKLTQKR